MVRLAEKVERPAGDELGPLEGSPLVVGGLKFWPLTWLARDWFYKWHDILTECGSPLADCLFAFAHIHSNAGNRSLLELDSYDTVKEAVEGWVRTLPLNAEQVAIITAELITRWRDPISDTIPNPDAPQDDKKAAAPSSDESLALLSSQLGGTPDYWRYDVAMNRTQAMYGALAKSMDTAGNAPDPHSPRIRAIHNYHQAVKWVIRNGE